MKKFHFSLDRVLDFRRIQFRLEQAKLERLIRDLNGIDTRLSAIKADFARSQQDLLHSHSSLGLEFEALDAFHDASLAQEVSLEQARKESVKLLTEQRQRIVDKEREVRLLEKLRADRLNLWKTANDREVDQQAEENFLARWGK